MDGGRGSAVIQQRMAFQELMRERFTAVVEAATGREVIGFMIGNQQDPDIMREVFILTPADLFGDEICPPREVGSRSREGHHRAVGRERATRCDFRGIAWDQTATRRRLCRT